MRWSIHFPQNADSYSTVTVKYDYGFPVWCSALPFTAGFPSSVHDLTVILKILSSNHKTPTWQQSICEQWFLWVRLTKCFEAIFMKLYGWHSLTLWFVCTMCMFSHVYPTFCLSVRHRWWSGVWARAQVLPGHRRQEVGGELPVWVQSSITVICHLTTERFRETSVNVKPQGMEGFLRNTEQGKWGLFVLPNISIIFVPILHRDFRVLQTRDSLKWGTLSACMSYSKSRF